MSKRRSPNEWPKYWPKIVEALNTDEGSIVLNVPDLIKREPVPEEDRNRALEEFIWFVKQGLIKLRFDFEAKHEAGRKHIKWLLAYDRQMSVETRSYLESRLGGTDEPDEHHNDYCDNTLKYIVWGVERSLAGKKPWPMSRGGKQQANLQRVFSLLVGEWEQNENFIETRKRVGDEVGLSVKSVDNYVDNLKQIAEKLIGERND